VPLDIPSYRWYKCQQVNARYRKLITFTEAEIRTKIIKALAHPVRLMIVDFLQKGEAPFGKIHHLFESDKSTVSKHLHVLKEAGIVSSRKSGLDMFYKLEVPCILDFFGCVTAVIENTVKKQQRCLCK
jgi:ArsR family transcriptional regulator, arsenate/arsenite/antimonite-responsive transcriptional repressor